MFCYRSTAPYFCDLAQQRKHTLHRAVPRRLSAFHVLPAVGRGSISCVTGVNPGLRGRAFLRCGSSRENPANANIFVGVNACFSPGQVTSSQIVRRLTGACLLGGCAVLVCSHRECGKVTLHRHIKATTNAGLVNSWVSIYGLLLNTSTNLFNRSIFCTTPGLTIYKTRLQSGISTHDMPLRNVSI